MSETPEIAILEMLASKICHDLISPIGAVRNGVELLEDTSAGGGEIVELISYSAGQASAKLQAFRLAYGVGGSDSNIKPEDVHKTIELIVAPDKKIEQRWNPNAPLGDIASKRAYCRILTCVLLLAIEALPKGGKIIALAAPNGGTLIKAEGTDAGLRGHAPDALALKIERDALEPKDVHAYMTGLLAGAYGFKIAYDPARAEFTIT